MCVCVFMSVPHLMSNEQAFLIYIHLIPNNFTNIIKFVGLTHTFFSLLFIANLSALKMYSIYTTTIFCFFFLSYCLGNARVNSLEFFLEFFPPESCVCAQLCPTLGSPMDWNLSDSSVHRLFQARILELNTSAI